jgi:hypothetical protein
MAFELADKNLSRKTMASKADLRQEAVLALLTTMRTYPIGGPLSFSLYASHYIQSSLKNFVAEQEHESVLARP